jgi:putative PIN family toxin of toxin-antitoxin system
VSRLAVYDTMIFFQWAALPKDRQHATVRALYDGSIRLCLSEELIDEVKDVLSRPEISAKAPHLTDDRIKDVLAAALEHADWVANVPKGFTLTAHPDDDHILNLAIAAKVDLLVTWETRLLNLPTDQSADGKRFQELTPNLKIITPKELAQELAK